MASHDAALVARLQARDADAQAQLVADYGPRVRQLALRLLRSREDAEEVASDALRKAIEKADRFRGDAALSTWLHSLTFNTAMTRLRRLKARRRLATADPPVGEDGRPRLPDPLDEVHVPDRQYERAELCRAVAAAMRDLPPVYRETFLLRAVRGLTVGECAQAMGVPVGTVKARTFRARSAVRARVAGLRPGRC